MLTVCKFVVYLHLQIFHFSVNMNERLVNIIDYYKLTQTEFAFRINVSKTLVSLIIKGQRPVTAAIVEKIKMAFPEISGRWLEEGEGNMVVEPGQMGNLFDANYHVESEGESLRNDSAEQSQSADNKKSAAKPYSYAKSKPSEQDDRVAEAQYEVKAVYEPKPEIERIVIFYTDGSFSEHLPKSFRTNGAK